MFICAVEERDKNIQEIQEAHPVMVMSCKKIILFLLSFYFKGQ